MFIYSSISLKVTERNYCHIKTKIVQILLKFNKMIIFLSSKPEFICFYAFRNPNLIDLLLTINLEILLQLLFEIFKLTSISCIVVFLSGKMHFPFFVSLISQKFFQKFKLFFQIDLIKCPQRLKKQ